MTHPEPALTGCPDIEGIKTTTRPPRFRSPTLEVTGKPSSDKVCAATAGISVAAFGNRPVTPTRPASDWVTPADRPKGCEPVRMKRPGRRSAFTLPCRCESRSGQRGLARLAWARHGHGKAGRQAVKRRCDGAGQNLYKSVCSMIELHGFGGQGLNRPNGPAWWQTPLCAVGPSHNPRHANPDRPAVRPVPGRGCHGGRAAQGGAGAQRWWGARR